jgi:signal transduction histidine kinase
MQNWVPNRAAMNRKGFTPSRPERLIAAGRVVLAACSLLAIWLAPSEPSRHAHTVLVLLTGYLLYAVVMLLVVGRPHPVLIHLPAVTHALDMVLFTVLVYFTEASTSPFFVYFVFSLVCATVRWQWRGILWTAAAALLALVGLSLYGAHGAPLPAFELGRLILRGMPLILVAVLLGYLAAYEHERRLRSELSRLAMWPHIVRRDADPLVRDLLEHAGALLDTPRVLATWEESEEPWLHVAAWSRGEFSRSRESPATFEPLVAKPLADADFLCQDASLPVPACLHTSSIGLQRWHGTPLHPDFQVRFAVGAVLCLRLSGEACRGRLFCLDKPAMTPDDLVLGTLVAHQIIDRMDHFYLVQRTQHAAAMDERIRLARDLHDGVLQSLTGAALQLQTVGRLFAEDPQAARNRLQEIQNLLAEEQRDLRFFIQELKPGPLGSPQADSDPTARLNELSERIERHWGLQVEVKFDRAGERIPAALGREIYRIVHEALVNAARHARASVARVELSGQGDHVRITVADDGRGFRFHGHYDHARLTEMKLGPVTLKERIVSLGGTLSIDSSESGARLEIVLPVARVGARDGD